MLGQRARQRAASPAAALNGLRDIPIVGDVRGAGHFWAIELVRDQETKATFEGPAAEWLLKDVLSEELWGRGLICRLDDRTEPIVQIAPPLVASAELIEEIAAILRAGLDPRRRADGRAPRAGRRRLSLEEKCRPSRRGGRRRRGRRRHRPRPGPPG